MRRKSDLQILDEAWQMIETVEALNWLDSIKADIERRSRIRRYQRQQRKTEEAYDHTK